MSKMTGLNEQPCPVCKKRLQVPEWHANEYMLLLCSDHEDIEVSAFDSETIAIRVSTLISGVDGYQLVPLTQSARQLMYHDTVVKAMLAGKPIPAPDFDMYDNSWIDPRLHAAFTAAVGEEGWIIRACDEYPKGVFRLNMQTVWDWDGVTTGTIETLAARLLEWKETAEKLWFSGAYDCPTCGATLHAKLGPASCACGTIAWEPLMWTSPLNAAVGVLPLLDGVGDANEAMELVYLAALTRSSQSQEEAIFDYQWQLEESFEELAEALPLLVPGAKWTHCNSTICGIIPKNTRFEPGAVKSELDAFKALGYELDIRQELVSTEDGHEYFEMQGFMAREKDSTILPFAFMYTNFPDWQEYAFLNKGSTSKPKRSKPVGEDAWLAMNSAGWALNGREIAMPDGAYYLAPMLNYYGVGWFETVITRKEHTDDGTPEHFKQVLKDGKKALNELRVQLRAEYNTRMDRVESGEIGMDSFLKEYMNTVVYDLEDDDEDDD